MAPLQYEKSLGQRSALGNIPPELHHRIFAYLKPVDVARIRLSCRQFAAIGVQYLVPEAFLVPLSDSFKRLQELSEHPVLRQYVTSIFYLGDCLPVYSRQQWEDQIRGPEKRQRLRDLREYFAEEPTETDTEGPEWEMQEYRFMPNHCYSSTQLDEAYAKYRRLVEDQSTMEGTDHQLEQAAKAMKGFPQLKCLTLSTIGALDEEDLHLITKTNKAYTGTFCQPKVSYSGPSAIAEHQVRSILLGASRAGFKIEDLKIREINWQTDDRPAEDFLEMMQSISCLKRLNIQFDGESLDNGKADRTDASSPKGWVAALVASVPLLKRLCVAVEIYSLRAACFPSLKGIIGNSYWPFLAFVELGYISAREEDLIDFFRRHNSTLTGIKLYGVYLSQGSWVSAIYKMRQRLILARCFLGGELHSVDEENLYDTRTGNQELPSRLAAASSIKLLEDYLIRVDGDNSLQELLSKAMADDLE